MGLRVAQDELGEETPLADLTPECVGEFYNCKRVTKLKNGKAKSQLSIDKTRRVLRLAFGWAAERGIIAKAPIPESVEAKGPRSQRVRLADERAGPSTLRLTTIKREAKMKLEAALSRYLTQLRADGRSEQTAGQHRRRITLLASWLREGAHRDAVEEIGHEDLAAFLASPCARTRPDGETK